MLSRRRRSIRTAAKTKSKKQKNRKTHFESELAKQAETPDHHSHVDRTPAPLASPDFGSCELTQAWPQGRFIAFASLCNAIRIRIKLPPGFGSSQLDPSAADKSAEGCPRRFYVSARR
jgi:hypothetical protein